MLEHGPSTESIPVFVTEGRRRHHAVRLAAATLGLLIAGWVAALAAGLMGFGPLPTLSLSDGEGSRPAAVTAPDPQRAETNPASGSATTASPVRHSQPASAADSKPTAGENGAATTRRATTSTRSSGTAGSGGGAGTGTSAPTPTGTGNGSTTPTGGTGGASQSNAGSEPAWTPPASGDKSATPPRGKSLSAPGATLAGSAPSLATQPSG